MGAFRPCCDQVVVVVDSGVVHEELRSGQVVGLATLARRCSTPPPPYLPILIKCCCCCCSRVREAKVVVFAGSCGERDINGWSRKAMTLSRDRRR